jgi:hypothetical protein
LRVVAAELSSDEAVPLVFFGLVGGDGREGGEELVLELLLVVLGLLLDGVAQRVALLPLELLLHAPAALLLLLDPGLSPPGLRRRVLLRFMKKKKKK